MSRSIQATIFSNGTVGCETQYFEPNSPFSSPSKAATKIDRLGGPGKQLNALANSIKAEVPLALSSAPG